MRDGLWRNVGLYRREWYGETGPLISCCYEWKADSTFADGARTVGLWVNRGDGPDLRDTVADQVRDLRSAVGYPKSNRSWPAFREAARPVTDEYWTDLSDYREGLVSGVIDAWEAFSERASRGFESWKGRLGG